MKSGSSGLNSSGAPSATGGVISFMDIPYHERTCGANERRPASRRVCIDAGSAAPPAHYSRWMCDQAVATRKFSPTRDLNQLHMPAIRYFDWIAHHAGRRPAKLAIHDLQTDRKFTYAAVHARSDRLAAALAAKGIRRGDRVALLAPNCAEYFELQFACSRLGAIMLPLNWRLAVPELQYILSDATPSLLVHDRSFADQAQKLSTPLLEIDHDRPDSAYEQTLAAAPQGAAPVAL